MTIKPSPILFKESNKLSLSISLVSPAKPSPSSHHEQLIFLLNRDLNRVHKTQPISSSDSHRSKAQDCFKEDPQNPCFWHSYRVFTAVESSIVKLSTAPHAAVAAAFKLPVEGSLEGAFD